MSEEEEIRRPQPGPVLGGRLDDRSVEELEAYIAQLRAEIERVEAEIRRRREIARAAEALFGRRSEGTG